jgi:hypothetical protein
LPLSRSRGRPDPKPFAAWSTWGWRERRQCGSEAQKLRPRPLTWLVSKSTNSVIHRQALKNGKNGSNGF